MAFCDSLVRKRPRQGKEAAGNTQVSLHPLKRLLTVAPQFGDSPPFGQAREVSEAFQSSVTVELSDCQTGTGWGDDCHAFRLE